MKGLMLAALVAALSIPGQACARRGHPPSLPAAQAPEPKIACTAIAAWVEARGLSERAIRGVMHVVLNRTAMKAFRPDACGVLLQRGQFYNPGPFMPMVVAASQGRPGGLPAARRQEAALLPKVLALARRVWAGGDEDPARGAVFFYCPRERRRLGFRRPPRWARPSALAAEIDGMYFYRLN